MFEQITQIVSGYPDEAFAKMPFATCAEDRLHEKYDFQKTQEVLGQDYKEGLRMIEQCIGIFRK